MAPFFSTIAYSRTVQQIMQDAAPTTLFQGIPRGFTLTTPDQAEPTAHC